MNKPIKIDKHVPIPETVRGRKGLYPFDKMDVGDSFFIPAESKEIAIGIAQKLRSSTSHRFRRVGERFSVFISDGGVRVWLTERNKKS